MSTSTDHRKLFTQRVQLHCERASTKSMRVSISHNKPKQEVINIVETQTQELLRSVASGPVQIADAQKQWQGDTMYFSFKGKMGFFSVPIKGTVEVRETEVIIDADLPGLVTKMISEEKIRAQVEGRVKGLLA